jgi:hypothetical protein
MNYDEKRNNFFFELQCHTNLMAWVDASYDGSKTTRVLIPKVHINGKINTRMEKQSWKPMLSGPYVVINQ